MQIILVFCGALIFLSQQKNGKKKLSSIKKNSKNSKNSVVEFFFMQII